uniref:C-type lectin domain-containing protein n=1 Tax=Stegastes partitus TaxID=144197 RepID=A0A3B4Z2R9_9TELE
MTYVSLTGWLILPSCPLRQYHFVNKSLSWHEAQTYCRETYTDLATTESMTEINQLIDTVSSSGYGFDVWIGLYNEINWRWSDGFTGSGAEYRNWDVKQPNFFEGNEFCVGITSTGHWRDMSCQDERLVSCYRGKDYHFVNEPLTCAQKYCRENFIDLATVRNEIQNQQLQNLVQSYSWIGLFRDPNFYWSDGSSFSFSHFDYVHNQYGSKRVICGYHFVNEPLTWHEAQSYCRETYTDLATTESTTEINQLVDTVSSSGYNPEVWIGLYTEIDWRWSDGFTGSGAEYRNWGPEQPNFSSANQFCGAKEERVAVIQTGGDETVDQDGGSVGGEGGAEAIDAS